MSLRYEVHSIVVLLQRCLWGVDYDHYWCHIIDSQADGGASSFIFDVYVGLAWWPATIAFLVSCAPAMNPSPVSLSCIPATLLYKDEMMGKGAALSYILGLIVKQCDPYTLIMMRGECTTCTSIMESCHLQDGPGIKALEHQHCNVSTTKVKKDPLALNG
jgi:hypothetical protein